MSRGAGPIRTVARTARGVGAAGLIVLLGSAVPGGARAADSAPPERLEALGEEFLAWRAGRAALGTPRGGGPRPLAAALSGTTLDRERAWLGEFRARLARVPRDETPGEPAAARALLEAAVEREALELEVVQPLRRDPGVYPVLVALSVEAELRAEDRSACARIDRAARRLAETPEVLRAARLNVVSPPRALTELAVERCAAVLRFLREDVPRLAAACPSPRTQADLAETDTFAVRALEAYQVYLAEDLLPTSRGEPAIGPEACRRILRASLLEPVGPFEELLAAARERVERRRAELDSVAREVAPGGLPAALDSLAGPASDAGVDDARAGLSLGRIDRFVRVRGLLSPTESPELRVRPAPAYREPPSVRLALSGRGPESTAWLEVTTTGGEATGPHDPAGPWELDLAVARECSPGRWLRAVALAGTRSRLRAELQGTWSGDDWGQYWERLLLEEGLGEEDLRYHLAGARIALREAGYALAALALHSGAMSADEVRRLLVERCLLEPGAAARATRRALADPMLMSAPLGAERLRETREEVRRRLGERFDARAFHDAALRFGASPPGIVRALVLHEVGGEAEPPAAR